MNGPLSHRDSGMSLIELIVVTLVSGLIISVIATLFINGWSAQQRATERNAVTAQLNATTNAITESVRNSVGTNVAATGKRLDAKVLTHDGRWECRAWLLQNGELLYGTDSSPWTSLVSGISGTFEQTDNRLSLDLELTQGEVMVAVTNGAVAQVVHIGGPECW